MVMMNTVKHNLLTVSFERLNRHGQYYIELFVQYQAWGRAQEKLVFRSLLPYRRINYGRDSSVTDDEKDIAVQYYDLYFAFAEAVKQGPLRLVKYLVYHGAAIHDDALIRGVISK
jgi:hypothetical protein